MDRETQRAELTNIISDYLRNKGLDLIDFIYRYEGRDLVLRILTDKPEGGITLGECASLNNELGRILDEKDILQVRYILEVSSPGLDRPLKTKNDFLRCCMNRKARFFRIEQINGKLELEGVITKVGDDLVCVDVGANIIEIPLSKIRKAKQVI